MGKEIQTPYLRIKFKFTRKFPKFICIQEILFPIFIMFFGPLAHDKEF